MKDVVHMFKALADPTRLRIMLLLRVRELCVCELTYILGMEQSRISHQMRILREAGLAEDIRQGRWMIYRIPERSREFVESLFASLEGARLGRSAPRNQDARKLAACVSENIRPRDCDSRPRPARPRSQPGRSGLHG